MDIVSSLLAEQLAVLLAGPGHPSSFVHARNQESIPRQGSFLPVLQAFREAAPYSRPGFGLAPLKPETICTDELPTMR
jgi:hypothetical protein